MQNYIIMSGILIFLLFLLIFNSVYLPCGNECFFDKQNSKAMRGFWCIIVILVHIPKTYQNSFQDLIGSFAYIGVTFFFMTSAYGLSSNMYKKPESIKNFWITRLPRLLIPNWLSNIIFTLVFFFLFETDCSLVDFISINGWVKWLLFCYIAFWIGYRFKWKEKYRQLIVCILIIVLSILFYYMKHVGIAQSTTWCTEVIGFIWGILFFMFFEPIKNLFLKNWTVKALIFCSLSLISGVLYLIYKDVFFAGDYLLKIILALFILTFILILNRKIKIGNNISWFIGECSYEIYLTHHSVFRLVDELFSITSSGVFILLSIILTILFATIIHWLSNIILKSCMTLFNKMYT